MILETSRLRIVPCSASTVAVINKQDSYPMGKHVEQHLDQLTRDPASHGWGVWFVILKDEETVIGDIGLKGKPDTEQAVEIGYGILPSYQNKGYGLEAVKALVHWVFSTGQVKVILAECLVTNWPSIRLLERLGMVVRAQSDQMLYWELGSPSFPPSKRWVMMPEGT